MLDERQYVFDAIGRFLSGSASPWDWDNFTSTPLRSFTLERIRRRAAAVDLPLNAEGSAILGALLVEVEQFTGDDPTKPKPWRMKIGLACGLLVGLAMWWANFAEGGGLFQNLHLLVLPAAFAVGVIALRNRQKQVGIYDPQIISRNKVGRV